MIFLRKDRKRILFLSSAITSFKNALDTSDYFASIASNLAIGIQKKFEDFDLVIKVTEGGENPNDNQIQLLNLITKRISEYELVIISPVDRDQIINSIKNILLKKKQIINIDQGYSIHDYSKFANDEVPRPPFVQANWLQGGRVAGESMVKRLQQIYEKKLTLNIVIVNGKVGSEQRIKGFKEILKKSKINVSYKECQGNYCKVDAQNEFSILLAELNWKVHGVFATNDEMAIGVRESLIHNSSSLKGLKPTVIGFDGIKDACILIENNDDFFYDTVDVQLSKQIRHLMKIVDSILKNEPLTVQEKFKLQPCISYRKKNRID